MLGCPEDRISQCQRVYDVFPFFADSKRASFLIISQQQMLDVESS